MDLGLAGRTALVTGADSGIGLACARELLAEGAQVVLADQYPDRLATAAADLGRPDRVHQVAVDVASPESVAGLAAEVREQVGDVDILVNAAGIHGPDGPFHELDEEGWRHTLDVNLLGAVWVTRAFVAGMAERGWGRVVFISSEDAVQPYDNELPYAVAKGGLNVLAKGMSRTYGKSGVLINAVSPAFIDTPMTDAMMGQRAEQLGVSLDEAISTFLDEQRPAMQSERRGRPEEVAAVVTFLCSARASFVTGSNYRVDAGSVWTV
ncbi:SDR family oxidoreductase [Georgenia sp. TF02-10]|uniref:SDR family NAD(P)-dependent oxidoreductase n=1 Tax=Georgenia sp. TF02-10 TaxID=2917725 RepID=UPI001FA7CB3A|nr:SDR family oxidoreductase [Georgenia sp. TF02-10]UNX53680.1 SDR family oxidoreductase [Georgenia sp. TF02-10]